MQTRADMGMHVWGLVFSCLFDPLKLLKPPFSLVSYRFCMDFFLFSLKLMGK